jgi:hypothetical protein
MMKRSKLVFAVSVLFLIGFSGCNSAKQDAPASHAQPGANAAQEASFISGKVVETMSSGGYTYVSLDNNGKKTWVAIPQSVVKVGQELRCQSGAEMINFTSKTLNRTFESVIFSAGIL